MGEETVKALQELKLTEYEAKVYLALLENSPLSGYAVSVRSGVPRSKVYEVLNGLAERGEVIASHGEPTLFTPLPPDELIAKRKRSAEAAYAAAERALSGFTQRAGGRDNIWNITGREAILDRIRSVIKHAAGRILLEIWKDDAEELSDVLLEASQNGVDILIVSYGELSFGFAKVFRHDMSEEITREYGGRWIVLSVDDREIVAGIVSLGGESRAAWTMHPGLVMPITEVIKHDLYIMEMLGAHRDALEKTFGPNLIGLRERYSFGPKGLSVASKLGLIQ